MKIIALKTEAGLKRLVSDLAGLEASEIELLTLEDDLLSAGCDPAIVAEAVAALDSMISATKKVRTFYLIVHGAAKKAMDSNPKIPKNKSGT